MLSRAVREVVDPDGLSLYREHVDRAAPLARRELDGFGLGNGSSFALIGLTYPLNTLHNAIGPNYQKDVRYFGDHSLLLRDLDSGRDLAFQDEWVLRLRGTAVDVTRAEADGVVLETVDFAPWTTPSSAPDDPLARVLVRLVVVRSVAGGGAPPARLALVSRATQRVGSGAGWIEESNGSRLLRIQFSDGVGDGGERELVRALPKLEGHEEQTLALLYVFGDGEAAEQQIAETVAAVALSGVEALAAETRDRWRAWIATSTTFETPDPKVNDLIDGMKVTLKVQQARSGGSSPMSLYTFTWLRDLYGTLRFAWAAGLDEDARAALDYSYAAILHRGDIANALPLDLDPKQAPSPPDWSSLPPLDGREAAEGPSYHVLAYQALWRSTGDLAPIRERWGLLRRCLDGQAVDSRGLLPFSGDETFRVAMAVGFGLNPVHSFETLDYSADSGFLYVRAAEALAEMAHALGESSDEARYREAARRVREATERYFWLGDGFYAPFIGQQDLSPMRRPYEDVNTQPLWIGYRSSADPIAIENLDSTIGELGGEDGTIQTKIPPIYRGLLDVLGFQVHDGVFTGMVPGFYLQNLSVADHPVAALAFETLDATALPSGNWGEYMIADDFSALSYHDPTGLQGNYTARYRPWEGGINVESLLAYVVGAEPDASRRRVRLAPRLPNGWPRLTVRGLRIGANRYDLEVEARGPTRRYRIRNRGIEDLDLVLVIRAGAGALDAALVEGLPVDVAGLERSAPYGLSSYVLPEFSLAAGGEIAVEARFPTSGS